MAGIFVALLIAVAFAVVVIVLLGFFYLDGRNDAANRNGYLNPHDGLLKWLYDLGYNADDAAEARRQRNMERNRQKRERVGE